MREPTSLPVIPAHIREPDDEGKATAPASSGASAGRVFAPFSEDEVPPETLRWWRALEDVRDPEMPVSIVDLGLVYDVYARGSSVVVDLTFTAMGCPCMWLIKGDIEERLLEEEGVDAVEIREVWTPPWTRVRMTEKAREVLRSLGVAA